MRRDHTLEQVAEMAHQAEIVCRMLEDHPHELDGADVSAIATLLKRLAGNVSVWLIEEKAQKEGEA